MHGQGRGVSINSRPLSAFVGVNEHGRLTGNLVESRHARNLIASARLIDTCISLVVCLIIPFLMFAASILAVFNRVSLDQNTFN
jgi:hypothetical protein